MTHASEAQLPTYIQSLADLKATAPEETELGGTDVSPVVVSTKWRPRDSKVQATGLRGTSWTILKSNFTKGLVISGGRWESVIVRECAAEMMIFEDVTIDQLDVRELRGPLSLSGCRVRQLLVHDSRALTMSEVFGESVNVSAVRNSILGTNVAVERISISECDSSSQFDVRFLGTRAREALRISACHRLSLEIRETSTKDLSVERCGLLSADLKEVEVEGRASLVGLRPGDDGVVVEASGHFMGGVDLSASKFIEVHFGNHGPDTSNSSMVVGGNVNLEGQVSLHLNTGRIDGVLRTGTVSASTEDPNVLLSTQFHLDSVDVDETPIRNVREARSRSSALLGVADPNALATLRRSLNGRPREQDQVYFAERCESSHGPFDPVKRWCFGYGVRLAEPLAALLIGILVTGLIVFVWAPYTDLDRSGPESIWPVSAHRGFESLISAAQLWFNVGGGLDEAAAGAGWGVLQLVCGILGLVLVTTLIGIGIRRLVR